MTKLLSSLITKKYRELGFGTHSVLRATEDLSDIDAADFGVGANSSLKVSVGYTFTSFKRNNNLRTSKKYSSENSFAYIYEKLVEVFGVSFVDVYFQTCFKSRFENQFRAETRKLLKSIDDEKARLVETAMRTKSGAFDKRTVEYKRIRDFDTWKSKELTDGFDRMSHDIKRHIRQCLATGRIPLNFSHKPSTAKRRTELGLTPLRAFFATGQLVDNLIISYTADWA